GSRIVTGIVVQEENREPTTQNPEPRTQNREPRTRNREPRTPNPEPRTGNAERRTPNAEPEFKPLLQTLDTTPFVPPDVLEPAQPTDEYHAPGVADTIPRLPPPMARGARADAHKTVRIAAITPAGHEALQTKITDKQREALELLAGTPAGIATPSLAARGVATDAISRLARHGYISVRRDRIERDPWQSEGVRHVPGTCLTPSTPSPSSPPTERTLTGEQEEALARLAKMAAAADFKVALLHGVTGSGKTEIYIRLSTVVRAAERSVLMLVPEIALTPAAAAQFRDAFGERVAIQHSGLSDGERHDQWQRIRRGEVDVVIGTRSAVFAPIERLGLIVVDEEHDGSYKQEESPRYNARDVAIERAQRAGALVVLRSARPAVESYTKTDV